jgi:hypothetical protein
MQYVLLMLQLMWVLVVRSLTTTVAAMPAAGRTTMRVVRPSSRSRCGPGAAAGASGLLLLPVAHPFDGRAHELLEVGLQLMALDWLEDARAAPLLPRPPLLGHHLPVHL